MSTCRCKTAGDGLQGDSLHTAQASAFLVLGIGLAARSRSRLRAAYPDCLLYSGAQGQAEGWERCRAGDRLVAFVDLPPAEGLAHTRTSLLLDQEQVKVLALCDECTSAMYEDVLRLEFSGALQVDASPETYRQAAEAVQRGELWISRRHLSEVARRSMAAPLQLGFSKRESSILKLLLEGASNREMADRLFISRETVRWHLKSLYAKLGASDRMSARQLAGNLRFPVREDAGDPGLENTPLYGDAKQGNTGTN